MNPAITAAIAVNNMNIHNQLMHEEDEIDEYYRIAENLDAIVAEGHDVFKFVFNTNVTDLPEYYQGPLEWLLSIGKHYKRPEESGHDYLDRVIATFDLYQSDNMIIANRRNLSLYFEEKKELVGKSKGMVTLFEPYYSDMPVVEEEMEIREHEIVLNFIDYSEHGDRGNGYPVHLNGDIYLKQTGG